MSWVTHAFAGAPDFEGTAPWAAAMLEDTAARHKHIVVAKLLALDRIIVLLFGKRFGKLRRAG